MFSNRIFAEITGYKADLEEKIYFCNKNIVNFGMLNHLLLDFNSINFYF